MKRKIISVSILSVAILSAFTFLSNSIWKVKEGTTKITFDVPADPHQLSFTKITATLDFDINDLKHSELIARIDVNSLQTEDPGLTKHLLSPDFLNAEKFPVIKFITSRIEAVPGGPGFMAYGGLAMKDSVHAVVIPFTFQEVDKNSDDAVFKGSFSIYAGDYGVMKKSKSGGDKVIISLEIPVTRTKGQ